MLPIKQYFFLESLSYFNQIKSFLRNIDICRNTMHHFGAIFPGNDIERVHIVKMPYLV